MFMTARLHTGTLSDLFLLPALAVVGASGALNNALLSAHFGWPTTREV